MAFIKSFKHQTYLLPPNICDMIPEDHICFLVEEIVEEIDFSEFEQHYSGAGHPAYHPRILCKILIQSTLDRVRPSRAVARNVRENLVYIYLAEKVEPDFRTISDFRKNNQDLLENVFKITVCSAKELGAVGLEKLSVDGTVIKASASHQSAVTEKELEVIEEYVQNELKKGIEIDRVEDELFGNSRGYDQLDNTGKSKVKSIVAKYIKQVNKSKKDRISEIKENVNETKEEFLTDKANKISLTDKDSRYMKNKKGKAEFSYNAQITVDHKTGIIVANDICQDRNDIQQLIPQIKITEKNCGKLEEGTKICADNGYYSAKNIEFSSKKKLDVYIPNVNQASRTNEKLTGTKKKKDRFHISNFKYDPEKDEYICPEQNRMVFSSKFYDKRKKQYFKTYRGRGCRNCKCLTLCTKSKEKMRILDVSVKSKEVLELDEKMNTKEGKKIFAERKQTVEPVIGNYKENLGFRNCLTRGIRAVKAEFNIVCAAVNIRKIYIFKKKKLETTDFKYIGKQIYQG